MPHSSFQLDGVLKIKDAHLVAASSALGIFRPIRDIRQPIGILQSQPAYRTFAAPLGSCYC